MRGSNVKLWLIAWAKASLKETSCGSGGTGDCPFFFLRRLDDWGNLGSRVAGSTGSSVSKGSGETTL